MKTWKKLLTGAGAAAAAGAGAMWLSADWMYKLALDPKRGKGMVLNEANGVDMRLPEENLLDTANVEEVWITSADGLRLHAWMAEQDHTTPAEASDSRSRWIIGAHGYTAKGWDMGAVARPFYERGYHVLFPDHRGHGKSEGDYIGMGWHDRLDLLRWIDYLISRDPDCEIILYGISMGGAAVMMLAGEELPDQVKLIIEDCGYSSVRDEFAFEAKTLFHLPYFPLVSAASLLTRFRAGYTFEEASAVKQLAKATRPMLFIHGDEDRFVPFAMLEKVYEAACCPKEKLVIQGAGHGQASKKDPQRYWGTVFDFIGRHLG